MTSNDPLPLPTHWNVGLNNSRPLSSYSLYALNELLVQHRRGDNLTQPDGMDQALTNEINRRETSQGYLARRRGPRRADDKANGQKIQKLQEDIVGLEKSGSIDSESIRRLQDTLRCKVQEIESLCKTVGTLRSQRNAAQGILQAYHIDPENIKVQPFIACDVKPTAVLIGGSMFVPEDVRDIISHEFNEETSTVSLFRRGSNGMTLPYLEFDFSSYASQPMEKRLKELEDDLARSQNVNKKLPNLPAAWKTATGRKIPITQLGDHHLGNIIKGNFTSKDPLMEEAILREKLRRANKTISRRINTLFNKRVNGSKPNATVDISGLDWADDQADIDYSAAAIDPRLTQIGLNIASGTGKTGFVHTMDDYNKNPDNYARTEEFDEDGMLTISIVHKESPQYRAALDIIDRRMSEEAGGGKTGFATGGIVKRCHHDFTKHRPNPFSPNFVMGEEVPSVEMVNKLAEQGTEKLNKLQGQVDHLSTLIANGRDQRQANDRNHKKRFGMLEALVGPGWKTAEGYVRSIFQLSDSHLENIIEGGFGSDEIRLEISDEMTRRLTDAEHRSDQIKETIRFEVEIPKTIPWQKELVRELEDADKGILKWIKRAFGGK